MLALPDRRRQRRRHEAPVRQPLRDGPVDARRHRPGDERPACRASASWSPATATAARGSRPGRGAWARSSPSPRSIRCAPSKRSSTGSASSRWQSAARDGEIFVTVTGNRDVLRAEHFAEMRDGAILANAGHFDVEIDLVGLARDGRRPTAASSGRWSRSSPWPAPTARRRLLVLAEGRLVNLSAAEGHPAGGHGPLLRQPGARHRVARRATGASSRTVSTTCPSRSTREIAKLKLETMGIVIDELTDAQRALPGLLDERDLSATSAGR